MNTAWSKPTKYIAGIGLVLLGIYLLYLSRPVIPLLILAALIAVIVRPVILWLYNRLHLPYGLAVALVYLLVIILVPLAVVLAVPLIVDAVGYVASLDYPAILRNVIAWLRSTLASIRAVDLPGEALDVYVDQSIDSFLTALQTTEPTGVLEPPSVETILGSLGSALTATFGAAAGLAGAVISQIALLVFMFLASIYISLGANTYRDALIEVIPPAYRTEFATLIARIERIWNAFFRGILTLMFIIGGATLLGLTVLGMPGALSLAIIAGLLEIIPSLGPVIAAIPAVVVALLQGSNYLALNNFVFAGLVILFYVLIQQIENTVIVPRVLGDALELPPLIIITGVLVGASVGGILGALLATPIIATGVEIVRFIYRKIQGKDPFPPKEAKPEPAAPTPSRLRERLRRWVPARGRFPTPASRRGAQVFTVQDNVPDRGPEVEDLPPGQPEIPHDDRLE